MYKVQILHYRDGLLKSEEESKIEILKSGFSEKVFTIAQEYSTLYGIFAVIIAVFIGWFANLIFRRI